MDIKQSLTYRSEELKQFEFTGNNKYDYENSYKPMWEYIKTKMAMYLQ